MIEREKKLDPVHVFLSRSRPAKTERVRSAQYEEIDLPGIQFARESWKGAVKTQPVPTDDVGDDNPYESIEGVKAKCADMDNSERMDSYTEIQRADSQEVFHFVTLKLNSLITSLTYEMTG